MRETGRFRVSNKISIDPAVVERALLSGSSVTECAVLMGCSPATMQKFVTGQRRLRPRYGVDPEGFDDGDLPNLIKLPPPPTREQLLRAKWAAIYLGLHSPDGRERLQAAMVANQCDLSELVDDSIDVEESSRRHNELVASIQKALVKEI